MEGLLGFGLSKQLGHLFPFLHFVSYLTTDKRRDGEWDDIATCLLPRLLITSRCLPSFPASVSTPSSPLRPWLAFSPSASLCLFIIPSLRQRSFHSGSRVGLGARLAALFQGMNRAALIWTSQDYWPHGSCFFFPRLTLGVMKYWRRLKTVRPIILYGYVSFWQ